MPLAVHQLAVVNGSSPAKGDKNTVYTRCGMRIPHKQPDRLPTHVTAFASRVTCQPCAQPTRSWRDLGIPI